MLVSNAQVGIARSGFFPQINATIAEEVRSSPFSENIRDVRNGYVVGATGSWAVWDWGQTYGRFKQAKAVLEQSKITYDDAVRQVEVEVQQAYSNMVQGRELIRSQQETVGQAQEALAARERTVERRRGHAARSVELPRGSHARAIHFSAGAVYLQRRRG